MSLNIGQFRSTDLTTYGTAISSSETTITTTTNGISFTDLAYTVSLETNKKYYLNINLQVTTGTGPVEVSILLKKSTSSIDSAQLVKTIDVSNVDTDFEVSFVPNSTYDQLVFQITRERNDYWGTARQLTGTINALNSLTNILDSIGVSALSKIGVQGKPGLLMNINGEEIHIGRTGIYEMLDDITVTFIGVAFTSGDFFLIDYQYE